MTCRRQWGRLGDLTPDEKVMGPFEGVTGEAVDIGVWRAGNYDQKGRGWAQGKSSGEFGCNLNEIRST